MRRRRTTCGLLLLLLAGVVGDAVLAFACARWAPKRGVAVPLGGFKSSVPTEGIRMQFLPRGYSLYAMVEHGPGFEYYAVLAIFERKRQTAAQFGNGMRLEAGLPFRSWVGVRDAPRIPHARPDYRAWFWALGPSPPDPGTLTRLRPLWPGFPLNAVLIGGLLGMAVYGPSVLRRRLRDGRRAAGLCARCRYPLRGLALCPECGTEAAG